MNDPTIRLSLGIGMILAGIILAFFGATGLWGGYQQWSAVSSLNQGRQYDFLGKHGRALQAYKEASSFQKHPATAIAGIDASGDGLDTDLGNLIREVETNRDFISLTQYYLSVLKNDPIEISGRSPNHELLRLIQTYQDASSTKVAPLPVFKEDEDVDPQVLRLALEHYLAASWKLGDLDALRRNAAHFAILYPKHPAANYARLLHASLAENPDTRYLKELTRSKRLPVKKIVASILRAATKAYPDNNKVLQNLIPSSLRTGVELISTMIAEKAPAEDLVKEAIRLKNDAILQSVTAYCLEIGRIDLIQKLSKHGGQDFRRMTAILLAQRDLDFATLKKFNVDDSSVRPQAMLMHNGPASISFHLNDQFGRVPSADVSVLVNNQVVDPATIKRLGSLLQIPINQTGRMALELRLGEQLLFAQETVR